MSKKHPQADTLQRFIFEKHAVRGLLVHLESSYHHALEHHDYSSVMRQYVAQALVSVVLMTSTIKFKGRFTLQAQSEGPIRLLLAQTNDQLHIRGLAQQKEEAEVPASLSQAMPSGQILININPDDSTERYQGITDISGANLSEALNHYFQQSEQLPTRLWIFADDHRAAGLLLQSMPGEPLHSPFWEHVETIASTIKEDELLNLSNEEILHRLFHEEDVRIFESEVISFQCQCTVEKMENAVVQLGYEDAQALLKEYGKSIEVACDFCGRSYQFDQVDVARLFTPGADFKSPDQKQ